MDRSNFVNSLENTNVGQTHSSVMRSLVAAEQFSANVTTVNPTVGYQKAMMQNVFTTPL